MRGPMRLDRGMRGILYCGVVAGLSSFAGCSGSAPAPTEENFKKVQSRRDELQKGNFGVSKSVVATPKGKARRSR